jgi:Methyltransferase domain
MTGHPVPVGPVRVSPVRVSPVRVSPDWLRLREAADGAARSRELLAQLRPLLPMHGPAVVHDLGCGTGAMTRWLAPRLAGAQHWVMWDRDARLLAQADAGTQCLAGDASAVTTQTRRGDVTQLTPGALAGATLVTCSALLDLLTAAELHRLVTVCAAARCPVLLTLTVTGGVELWPPDPLDQPIAEAFNAHQRRSARHRRQLGPDAVDVACDAFDRLGYQVTVGPSPWRLGAGQAALAEQWFEGWVHAAREQSPRLVAQAGDYVPRRTAQASQGELDVTVHHVDLLVRPR